MLICKVGSGATGCDFVGTPVLARVACWVGQCGSQFGRAGPQGSAGVGCIALARMMRSERNGVHQYLGQLGERRFKK